MAEDQFTSVQWDRGEEGDKPVHHEPITELEEERDGDGSQVEPQLHGMGNDIHNGDNHDAHGDIMEEAAAGVNDGEFNESQDNQSDADGPSNSLLMSQDKDQLDTRQEEVPVATNTTLDQQPHLEPSGIPEKNQAFNEDASMINQAEMIHNFETYKIHAEVSEPIRDIDLASKPFISYLISTETDNPGIIKLSSQKDQKSIKISCRRRYGDFRNLYHCLSNDFPTVLIPPLPSKLNLKYLTGDTFSSEFVHKRLNSLNRCIKFINTHKYLSQLSVYHLFLSDTNDWNSFSSNLKIHNINEVEKEQSFTSNMVNKVVNEEIITETVMNFLTPSKHKRETNKEILEISDKLKKLYENLIKLDKIFIKLNKKNNDLSVDYNLFLVQIEKLSQLNESSFKQQPVATPGGEGGDASNNSTLISINDNFKFFAECLKQYLENWSNSFKFINESFLTSLKDCSKYIINLTNLIELQHNKKIDLEVLQDYLDKARSELSNMPSSDSSGGGNHRLPPSPIKNKSNGIVNNTTQLIKDTLSTSANGNIGSSNTEQKRIKLQNKITQLEQEISNQSNLVNNLINKIIYEEYPNWDKFNKNELKSSMLELCDNQIEFYKGLVDNWNETELKLMKRIDELS